MGDMRNTTNGGVNGASGNGGGNGNSVGGGGSGGSGGGSGGRRGLRERMREEGETLSSASVVMGERAKVRLHISRLFTERDSLLERASQDTRKRTQLQKDIVALDEKVRLTGEDLTKAQACMQAREDEILRLRRRIHILNLRNRADGHLLRLLGTRIACIRGCPTFKAGRLVRRVKPYMECAGTHLMRALCLLMEWTAPVVKTFANNS